jgi:hypothetical protein
MMSGGWILIICRERSKVLVGMYWRIGFLRDLDLYRFSH